jgi:hypothetical protein
MTYRFASHMVSKVKIGAHWGKFSSLAPLATRVLLCLALATAGKASILTMTTEKISGLTYNLLIYI